MESEKKITITQFKGVFCGSQHTMFSINNTQPDKFYGASMSASEECPKCKTRNIFVVYEPREGYKEGNIFGEIYDCKCPVCGQEFDIIEEFEAD